MEEINEIPLAKRPKWSRRSTAIISPPHIAHFSSEYNFAINLKCFLEQIRISANGKTSYKDFNLFTEMRDFVNHLWPYIYTVNSLESNHIQEYIVDIMNGWGYIRGFLPAIFEFPSEYVDIDDNRDLHEKLETSIDLGIPREIANDYYRVAAYYDSLDIEKLNKVKLFFSKHTDLSFFKNDETDVEISTVLDSYGIALSNLRKFHTPENFEDIRSMAI